MCILRLKNSHPQGVKIPNAYTDAKKKLTCKVQKIKMCITKQHRPHLQKLNNRNVANEKRKEKLE